MKAQGAYATRLPEIERLWRERFGDAVDSLRASLTLLVGEGTASSPLFAGLEPPPNGWRAKVPTPETLPHFPMILHRGGYPDGS